MTERLPYVQQNRSVAAGGGHNAQEWRWLNAGASGVGVCGPGHLKVTASGTSTVTVAAGGVFIPDGASGLGGLYHAVNDAAATLTPTAGHSTYPRVDRVIAEVLDTAFGGASDLWRLRVVAGTAAASPSPPTLPARSVSLATIAVAANQNTFSNANLTDLRIPAGAWASAQGLIYQKTGGTAISSGTVVDLFGGTNTVPTVPYRYYAVKYQGVVFFSAADAGGEIILKRDGTTITRLFQTKAVSAGNSFAVLTQSASWQATTSSFGLLLTLARTVGSGNMTIDSTFGTPTVEVIDLGGGLS